MTRRATFAFVGPDETASNRLQAVFETTSKQWMGEYLDSDENMKPDGRVLEMLSEHQCEGWLEGYLLTGGHGLLSSYEAFIHMYVLWIGVESVLVVTTHESFVHSVLFSIYTLVCVQHFLHVQSTCQMVENVQ